MNCVVLNINCIRKLLNLGFFGNQALSNAKGLKSKHFLIEYLKKITD